MRVRLLALVLLVGMLGAVSPAFAGRWYFDASACRATSGTAAERVDQASADTTGIGDPSYTIWKFDDAQSEGIACPAFYPAGAATSGTPFRAFLVLQTVNANTGDTRWSVDMSCRSNGTPLDNVVFGTAVAATHTVASGSSNVGYYLDMGANMAPAVLTEDLYCWLRISRVGGDGADTFTGDMGFRGAYLTW